MFKDRDEHGVGVTEPAEGVRTLRNGKITPRKASLKRNAPQAPQALQVHPQALDHLQRADGTRELTHQEQAARDKAAKRTLVFLRMISFATTALGRLTKVAFVVGILIFINTSCFQGSGPSGLAKGFTGCWIDHNEAYCSGLKAALWPSLESSQTYEVTFKISNPSDVLSSTPLYEVILPLPLRHPVTQLIILLVMIGFHYLLACIHEFSLNAITAINRNRLRQALREGAAH